MSVTFSPSVYTESERRTSGLIGIEMTTSASLSVHISWWSSKPGTSLPADMTRRRGSAVRASGEAHGGLVGGIQARDEIQQHTLEFWPVETALDRATRQEMADACNLGEAVVTGPPPNSSYAYIVMVGPLGAGHRMWLLAAFAVFSALRRLGLDLRLRAARGRLGAPRARRRRRRRRRCAAAGAAARAPPPAALAATEAPWLISATASGTKLRPSLSAGAVARAARLRVRVARARAACSRSTWAATSCGRSRTPKRARAGARRGPAPAREPRRALRARRRGRLRLVPRPALDDQRAGWFARAPGRAHFAALSALLLRGGLAGGTAASRAAAAKAPGAAFDAARFWGHAREGWLNADRRPMPAGWGFFDGKGNQGQMYSYFRSATAGGRATPPPPPPPSRALSRG